MIKRYYIVNVAALAPGLPAPAGHHFHNMSDGVHAVVVTHDTDFGSDANGGAPAGWNRLRRLMDHTPLSAAAVTLLAPDYGVVTGDTMAIAAFKIAAVHPAFDPET